MTCYAPLTGYRSAQVNDSGKRGIVFARGASFAGLPMKLPCGQCVGCRLKKAREWAVRCLHEVQMADVSTFLTLTYDDDHLPPGGTLVKRDVQLFMKRLRKAKKERIRFYAGGEYGDNFQRPHYHLLLFGCDFGDKRVRSKSARGDVLYSSKECAELWPMGFNTIGAVTPESAMYVARYCMKKVTGEAAQEHYLVQTEDGELISREPEFALMSRRPGLGSEWFDKFGRHSFRHDSVIMGGREIKPPRYYEVLLDRLDNNAMARVKRDRLLGRKVDVVENGPDRLRVREYVALDALTQKKGSL